MRVFVESIPALWWLLGALVPVALHLLARARTDQQVWPSLRFLEASPLSLRRWATLRDPALLVARVALVCMAALAVAGPVVVTPGRERAARQQVARAIVSDGGSGLADDERRDVAASAVFVRPSLRDAVEEATRWLAGQSAFRHELVVVSPFRRGRVDAGMFAGLAPATGLRLVRVPPDAAVPERELVVAVREPMPASSQGAVDGGRDRASMALPNDSEYSVQADTNDGGPRAVEEDEDDPDAPWPVAVTVVSDPTGRWSRHVERWRLAPDRTERRLVGETPMSPLALAIDAQASAVGPVDPQALLHAVAAQGIRLPPSGLLSETTFPWEGRPESLTAAVASAAALPVSQWEPELMSDAELRAVEREPRPEGTPAVTGLSDRSWFWAMVLILMMVESWLRERRA